MELSRPNIGFVTDDYVFFLGGIFSQWKSSLFNDESGRRFHTAEHYMVYHKLRTLGHAELAEDMLLGTNPSVVKRAGRTAKATPEALAEWDRTKFDVVVDGNMLKFLQNHDMRKEMLNLYPRGFVEASPYDRIWGIGLGISTPDIIRDPKNWRGQNLLGKALDYVATVLSERNKP